MFQTHIFDEMKDDIAAAILGLIREERDDGNTSTRKTNGVKSYVKMYVDMGGCLSAFRDALLTDTRLYYRTKRGEWISHLDYYVKVQAAIEFEEKLFEDSSLLTDCRPKIKSMLEEEMMFSREAISLFAELYIKRNNSG